MARTRNAWPRGRGTVTARASAALAHAHFTDSGRLDDRVRPVVGDSWRRSASHGIDPDTCVPRIELDTRDLHEHREHHPLAAVMPLLRHLLVEAAPEPQIAAVGDAEGRLLWVEGDHRLRTRAEAVHFVEGANWHEASAGTNAPGVALALDREVQIFATEHFSRGVHAWSCSAAPLHDPETGRVVGFLDLTGSDHLASPAAMALVRAAASAADAELRALYAAGRLAAAFRTSEGTVPEDAPSGGTSWETGGTSAVDGSSLCSGVSAPGTVPGDRVSRGGAIRGRTYEGSGGSGFVSRGSGAVIAAGIPGPRPPGAAATAPGGHPATFGGHPDARRGEKGYGDAAGEDGLYALGRDGALLTAGGETTVLSPRHSEILLLLADHPAGLTGGALGALLTDRGTRPVTLRAEMVRLRRLLGEDFMDSRPYRLRRPLRTDADRVRDLLAEGALADALAAYPGHLLPSSDAPGVTEARAELQAELCAVLEAATDPGLLVSWAEHPAWRTDPRAVASAVAALGPDSPRRRALSGRLARLAH